jgi:cytosine deaminase
MQAAVEEALKGRSEGGIPIGSVIVHNDKILGRGHNQRIQKGSAILHGEMDAFENAGRQDALTYQESVLYTTLSPCHMCSGAILLYGIKKVVIGENINFKGVEDLLMANGVELKILNDPGCIKMMKDFINEFPTLWNEDIGVPDE